MISFDGKTLKVIGTKDELYMELSFMISKLISKGVLTEVEADEAVRKAISVSRLGFFDLFGLDNECDTNCETCEDHDKCAAYKDVPEFTSGFAEAFTEALKECAEDEEDE